MGDAAHIILHRFRHRRFIFIAFSRVPRDDWKIFLLDAIDGALLVGDETAEIQKNTFLFRTNDGKMLILRGGNETFLWSGAIESWKSILWLNFNFFYLQHNRLIQVKTSLSMASMDLVVRKRRRSDATGEVWKNFQVENWAVKSNFFKKFMAIMIKIFLAFLLQFLIKFNKISELTSHFEN